MEKIIINTTAKCRTQWEIERLFASNGPFYHVCSKPLEDALLFYGDEDKKAALAYLAITCDELNARLLAYALMSNHFHLLLNCPDPELYFEYLVEKLEKYLSRHGHPGIKLPSEPTIVKINTLKQLRDAIAYIIRNEYVVNPNTNPLSCLWCSGFLYYNPVYEMLAAHLKTVRAKDISLTAHRRITKSRDLRLPDSAIVYDDTVMPTSFVDVRFAESMFESARQFTVSVFKNVEAQVETALSLGETPVIPDEEMSGIVYSYCKRTWDRTPKELSRLQQTELMKQLKNTYRSSNAQISRLTGIPQKEVNAFYPLGAKRL